jgi:DNA-directed RNA polymerase specialized sigma subunit
MTTEYAESKKIIKSVCSKAKLREYISDCSFEHEHDAEILSMIYLQNKDCGYVADIMGLSYDQTLERHRKAAKRLAALINAQ